MELQLYHRYVIKLATYHRYHIKVLQNTHMYKLIASSIA